jgi:hypothetical protein
VRLIIAGSRTVRDHVQVFTAVQLALMSWFPVALAASPVSVIDEVISGGCEGVDLLGERWAKLHGIPVKTFLPDWKQYGNSAGPVRNREMATYAAEAESGALVAIWQRRSRGTASMIRLAEASGLSVYVKQVR